MILMEQPSVVFHSHDVRPSRYRMAHTIYLDRGATVYDVALQIKSLNQMSPLRNIIFNCHGREGQISIGGIGQLGIRLSTFGAFSILSRDNIGTIWLTSCEAAKGPEGKQLCHLIARVAGTQVIAGDEDQGPGAWETFRLVTSAYYNQIDDFAGNIYSFSLAGGVRRINSPGDSVWTIKT